MVLVAKFPEGAWITVLMIPLLILLMVGVHRHYEFVNAQSHLDHLELAKETAPFAILPVSHWNRASQTALQFACSLTPDVQVLHIEPVGEPEDCTTEGWNEQLASAAKAAGITEPEIVALQSPYRFITSPILKYVLDKESSLPDRRIAVIVPELVTARWYQYLLHNHRSAVLRTLLLLKGNRRIVVINVPWYLPG